MGRIGIWLIGSKGGVAITTIVGLVALKKGLVASTGLVSQLVEFAHLDLASWDDFVIGGHEIRGLPLCREAYRVTTEMRAASREVIDRAATSWSGSKPAFAPARPGTWGRRSPPWPTWIFPAARRRGRSSIGSRTICGTSGRARSSIT